MKKIFKTNINWKSRKVVAGLLALGMCLVVLFIFIGTIFLTSKNDDNYIDSSDDISSTSKPLTSGSNTYYASITNLDTSGGLNTVGTITDVNSNTVMNNNFYKNLMGAQSEYIYFGTNNFANKFKSHKDASSYYTITNGLSTSAIKWQVLAKGDTKYGATISDSTTQTTYNNNILLFADYQLGASNYTSTMDTDQSGSNNPNYAFWGTSGLRALLNGTDNNGTPLQYSVGLTANSTATKDTTAFSGDSYYSKIFSDDERSSIRYSNAYRTDLARNTYGDSNYSVRSVITDDAANSSGANGHYYTSLISNTNPAAVYATLDGSRVYETTSDYLFLLDYYDINNTAYGFGDASTSSSVLNGKQVYADLVMSNADASDTDKTYTKRVLGTSTLSNTGKENTYDYYVQNGYTTSLTEFPYTTRSGKTSSYLQYSYSTGTTSASVPNYSSMYWLRNALRNDNVGALVMTVQAAGQIGTYRVSTSRGVRPAFNFSPENVVFATAATVPTSATFTSVTDLRTGDKKPAYKLYLKSSNYKNYNSIDYTSASNTVVKPTVKVLRDNTTKANSLQITNKAEAGNKVIVLLADKSGTGAVDYMATATFGDDGIAKVNMPSGVNVAKYAITTLYASSLTTASDSTSLLTETVTGSYVADTSNTIANPTDFEITYAGTSFSGITAFSTADWYDSDDYNPATGSAKVTVTFTKYDSTSPELESNGEALNVGKYNATFTLVSGYTWGDGTNEPITVVLTILQKEVQFNLTATLVDGYATGITYTIDPNNDYASTDKTATKPPTATINYYDSGGNWLGTTMPNSKGSYYAKMVLDSELPSSNYTIVETDTAYPNRVDFSLGAGKVTEPTFLYNNGGTKASPATSYVYQGDNYEFDISGYDDSLVVVKVTFLPIGAGYSPEDLTSTLYAKSATGTSASGTLKLLHAGNYVITFDLSNTSDYVWSKGGTSTITNKVTITQASLTVSMPADATFSGWTNADTSHSVWVNVANILGNDATNSATNIYLAVKLDETGKTTANVFTNASSTSSSMQVAYDASASKYGVTVAIPKLAADDYTLTAELDATTLPTAGTIASVYFNNYDIMLNYTLISSTNTKTAITKNFTVSAAPGSAADLQWYYKNGTGAPQTAIKQAADNVSYTVGAYNGNEYYFYLDDTEYINNSNVQVGPAYDSNGIIYSGTTKATDAGTYTVSVTMTTTGYDTSVNYTGATTYTLTWTIEKVQFDLSNVSWDYTTAFTYDSATARTVELVGLNGVTCVDSKGNPASVLATLIVKGYNNNKATNAGTYTADVTFALQNSADATNFEVPTATTSGAQNYYYNVNGVNTFPFTLNWTIDKAQFDLSNVKWNYEVAPFRYTGTKQTVAFIANGTGNTTDEIAAELPVGLIASVSGLDYGTQVGDKGNVQVTFTLDSTTPITNADGSTGYYNLNYVCPTKGGNDYVENAADPFSWTLAWEISKAVIVPTWTTTPHTDVNGQSFNLAVLADENGQPILDANLGDSTSKVAYTYFNDQACTSAVVGGLSGIVVNVGNTVTYYAKVEVSSSFATRYEIDQTSVASGADVGPFYVGDSRTAVNITLGANNVYNTQPQAVVFTNDAGVADSEFVVTYYATSADRAAGTNSIATPTDAGTYYVALSLKSPTDQGFVITTNSMLTYVIEKKPLDVTNLGWNYDSTDPYQYTLENGVEKVYEVKLVGYTDTELDSMFSYNNNTGSSVYTYTTTTYSINANRTNYELVTYDSQGNATAVTDAQIYAAVPQNLVWEIVARKLTKPAATSITFDDATHDLINLCGIDVNTDWAEYLDVTITKDGDPYLTDNGDFNTAAYGAGTYTLSFAFNSKAATNAGWVKADGTVDHYSMSVDVTVDKLKIVVSGWRNNPPEPKFDTAVGSNFYEVVYERISDGHTMDKAEALTVESEPCLAYIQATAAMADNVEIVAKNDYIPLQKTYIYSSAEPTYLTRPTLTEAGQQLAYTGQEIDITQYLENFNSDKMFISGDVNVTNAGEYQIVIGIKDEANAFWDGEDNWDNFSIGYDVDKRVIAISWDTTGKIPVLTLPADVEAAYTIYDEAGNEVARENMVNEGEYTVVANLTEDTAANNSLEDTSQVVAVLTNSASDDFIYTYHTFLNLGFWEVDPDFPCVQLVIIAFCMIVTMLCFIKGSQNLKAAKKVQNEAEDKYSNAGGGDANANTFGGLVAGGAALLASSGGGTMLWTIIAVAAIGIMLFAVIFLIVSSKKQGSARADAKKAEKDFKKRQAEEQKAKEDAERVQREKEEREEEKKAAKEEREAERVRQEKADEQKQMMMMMMMKGGSSGGGGGSGGGGTTTIPYPVPTPTYTAPVQAAPQQSSGTDDIVARVVAALNPTLQSQQAQLQRLEQQQQSQQQVKDLEERLQQRDRQQRQEDKFKTLEEKFARHNQEKQDEKFKALQDELEQHKKQQDEQAKLAEQQQLTRQQIQQELDQRQAFDEAQQNAKRNEERNQEFTKYMLDRSSQPAKDAEERRRREEQDQIKALEEQIKLQKQLIEEIRSPSGQANANTEDKTALLIELLQKTLRDQNDKQSDDRAKLFEETLKKQEQLIEELRAKSEKTDKDDNSSRALEQLQLMLQKQLEQQMLEQENRLAKQQAEFEKRLHEQQLTRQQELQAQQQDQSRQQIRALEEQLNQQKEAQAKEQEQHAKLLEQQRQEQEKKLEEIKNQKDQAELLAELRSQREPVKQDDATNKILKEHSKTLEQIAKQQAEMQAKQQEQEQERLRQEQERQRKELEQRVQDQADQIKELRAKNGVVPNDGSTADGGTANDKTAQILEEYSKTLDEQAKTLEQIAKQQSDLQEQQKAKEDAQKQKELEDIIKQQAREIEELKRQNKPEYAATKDDDKATKILEQHSKTLEEQSKTLQEQGKTLEKLSEQQGKTLEKLSEQGLQKPYDNQYQQVDYRSQQLARQQAEWQARQLAQEQADLQARQYAQRQAELQARQNADQQVFYEQQARELAQKQAELQTQQQARQQAEMQAKQAEMQAKQLAEQNAKQQAIIEEQARQLAQHQNQAELQAQQLAQRQAELQAQQLAQRQAELQARQNADQQAFYEQQARELAQKQAELQAQQQAKLFEQQLQQLQQTQQTNDVPNDELKKDNLTKK